MSYKCTHMLVSYGIKHLSSFPRGYTKYEYLLKDANLI